MKLKAKWKIASSVVLTFAVAGTVSAASIIQGTPAPEVKYTWNGQAVEPSKPAVEIDDSLYMPLRAIAELTGQYVDYDDYRRSVALTDKPQLTGKYKLEAPDLADGVKMGVGSSLTHLPGDPSNVFYTTADRGPNGEVEVGGETRRTFPLEKYNPSLYKIEINNGKITILETIPLKVSGVNPATGSGAITGKPNIEGRDETPYDASAQTKLSYDPYGLDIEGLAYNAKDDTFWISEEYGPSIVQVKRDGTIVQRIVPQGWASQVATPLVPARETLPAAYLKLRSNRGAEAVGITPDGNWMFMAMQSPLRNPDKSVDGSRQLRIIKIDLNTLKPVGEFVYQAEDASKFKDVKQADIVISDLVAVNENVLLVDERDKFSGEAAQLKRIYAVGLSNATNVMGRFDDAAAAGKTLEQMTAADLRAQGVAPVSKHTVIDAVEFGFPFEKIEGLSLINGDTIAIINDNDFGIGSESAANGTELWTFKLPYVIE